MKKLNKKILIPLITSLTFGATIMTPLLVSCGNKNQPAVDESISISGIPQQTIQILKSKADKTAWTISVNYSHNGLIIDVINATTFTFIVDGANVNKYFSIDNGKIAWTKEVPESYVDKNVTIQASYTNEAGKVFNASATFKVNVVDKIIVPASLTFDNIDGDVSGTAYKQGSKTDKKVHLWFVNEHEQSSGGAVSSEDVLNNTNTTIEFFNNGQKVGYFGFDQEGHITWTNQVPVLNNVNITVKATYKYTKDGAQKTISTDPIGFTANFVQGVIAKSLVIPTLESEYHLTNYGAGIDYTRPILVNYIPPHSPDETPDTEDVTKFSKLTLLKKNASGSYEELSVDGNLRIEYRNMVVPNVGTVNGYYICWYNKTQSEILDLKIRAVYGGITAESNEFKLHFDLAEYLISMPTQLGGLVGQAGQTDESFKIVKTSDQTDITESLKNNFIFYQNETLVSGVYSIASKNDDIDDKNANNFAIAWNNNVAANCGFLHLFLPYQESNVQQQLLYVGSVPFYFISQQLHGNVTLPTNPGVVGTAETSGVSSGTVKVIYNNQDVTMSANCHYRFFLNGNEIKDVFSVAIYDETPRIVWNKKIPFVAESNDTLLYINVAYKTDNDYIVQYTEGCKINVALAQ